MKLTNLAVDRHTTIFVLIFMVLMMGTTAYLRLPREANPDVKIPFVMVYAPYFGTSPYDMENLVTRKLETQLKALPDLVEMSSTSSEGVSTVVLEFTPDAEMIDVLQKVRDGVELAKPELPQDVRDDLLVYELSSDTWPIMQVVVSGQYDPVLLKQRAEDLQEDIESIKGVLSVDLTGGIEREVAIEVDPERLEFYGLGLPDIQDAIAFENVTIPGGDLDLGHVQLPGARTGRVQGCGDDPKRGAQHRQRHARVHPRRRRGHVRRGRSQHHRAPQRHRGGHAVGEEAIG